MTSHADTLNQPHPHSYSIPPPLFDAVVPLSTTPRRGASKRMRWRGTPNRASESQISLSLFHSPTCESTGPTSNRPYSPISMLNDDVLLNIFKVYRLYQLRVDHGDDDGYRQSRPRWDHQRWWYKIVHVSRQWRHIILLSPVQLDIHLLCTYGVPVADMLAHSLHLPLTVFYYDAYREMTTEDEEGALLALSLRHRVRRIALLMPNPNLGKFMTAIDDEFPILERMWIRSQSKDSTELVFPQAGKFQAPNLRHIWTTSIGFPPLTYTAGLVHLKLIDIPAAAYLPPSYILPRILLMRQLETLMIHFRSPPPNGVVEKQALNTPITAHPLLHLHLLSFRGVSDYLEGIITQIGAPVLSTLDIHFFHQAIPFNISCLRQFTKNLIFSDVELNFKGGAVTLVAGPGRSRPLCVEVMCRRLDWQVSCAVEILGSFSPILSAVEKLALRHVELSESPNEVNRTQWRELFKPFNNVKTLLVPSTLARGLAHSLCSKAGESPMELLPNLLELRCPGGSVIAFYSFIFARKVAGHPVRLVCDSYQTRDRSI
jgi:hypothetical protein